MPEQSENCRSQFQGEEKAEKCYLKLGKKVTDVVFHHIGGIDSNDPEYWGLKEVLTPEMCEIAQKMKLRKYYTLPQLVKKFKKYDPKELERLLEEMSYIGILEYDYGDNYDHNHEIKDKPRVKRYRLPIFVPGSAELFNSSVDRIDKNPPVASFFERMTFLPLAGVTQMVMPGGDGIGMHVIPVEEAINAESKSVDLEHISYWLEKYDGHIASGICSCRASRAKLGEGCVDDVNDWCIQLGDMADYAVETNRAHYITKERALEILKLSEKNGFVHQITNIDGEEKIFDICNCDVKICNALRTSLLFNTPYLSKSAYTAKVDKDKCAACGKCVESCPAGAVKLSRRLCDKNGDEVKYKKTPLPDNNKWGRWMWDEDYRDTTRLSNTYDTGSSPCKAACPAHVPVQAYLQKAKEGKYEEALSLIKSENPFPSICGRVCNKRCEGECTRGSIDSPVSIDAVKKAVSDYDMKKEKMYIPEKVVPSVCGEYKEKIAIVGSGPAGLSAAYFLALKGFKPTVFEKNEELGGMMRYGIPSFKLEKDTLDKEISVLKELGVEFKTGINVGEDITLKELRSDGYKAFYIALGCQKGKMPKIGGENAEGVLTAVDFLRKSLSEDKPTLSGKTIIIGGGNVAIDSARTSLRLGSESVQMYCLEPYDKMPSTKEEVEEAESEGIKINPSWGPKEILTNDEGKVSGVIFKKCTSVWDENGKFSPRYDEDDTITIECNNVVLSIGQDIEWGNLLKDEKVEYWHGNYPVADKFTYRGGDSDLFFGGDVYTGPKFVIDAIASGHEAAESLSRFVIPNASLTIGRDRRSYTPLNKDDITFPSYDNSGRIEAERLNVEKLSFRESLGTLTDEEVKSESSRCLKCGVSRVDPDKCIGCGLCTTKCLFDAIHLEKTDPRCTNMRNADDKIGGILSYQIRRAFKILFHSGSKEAREIRAKKKEYKKATKCTN